MADDIFPDVPLPPTDAECAAVASRARAAADAAEARAAEWAWRKGVIEELRKIRENTYETSWRLGCLLFLVALTLAIGFIFGFGVVVVRDLR